MNAQKAAGPKVGQDAQDHGHEPACSGAVVGARLVTYRETVRRKIAAVLPPRSCAVVFACLLLLREGLCRAVEQYSHAFVCIQEQECLHVPITLRDGSLLERFRIYS